MKERQESNENLHKHSAQVQELSKVIDDLRMQNESVFTEYESVKAVQQERETEFSLKIATLNKVYLFSLEDFLFC